MADSTGIGGSVDARTPAGFAGATTGGNVAVLALSESGGFFDADDVVFKPQVGIDVGFVLVMTGDDARTVLEGNGVLRCGEEMRELREDAMTKVFEVFQV